MNITANEAITTSIGAIFTVIGLSRRNSRIKMLKTGITVDGVVVSIKENRSTDSDGTSITYSPVIKYTTKDNQTITKNYDVHSYPCPYKIGDKLKVIYDHDDAEHFILNDGPSIFIEIVFFGLGVILLTYSAVLFII